MARLLAWTHTCYRKPLCSAICDRSMREELAIPTSGHHDMHTMACGPCTSHCQFCSHGGLYYQSNYSIALLQVHLVNLTCALYMHGRVHVSMVLGGVSKKGLCIPVLEVSTAVPHIASVTDNVRRRARRWCSGSRTCIQHATTQSCSGHDCAEGTLCNTLASLLASCAWPC